MFSPYPGMSSLSDSDSDAKRKQPDLSVRHMCPNCRDDPPNIIEEYSHGDLVCGDCGTVLGDRIVDTRSEWRTFEGDQGADPSRVGGVSNPLLDDTPLETTISGIDGRTGISRDLQRAQKNSAKKSTTSGLRPLMQLQEAFRRISDFCDTMNLPRAIIQRAQHAYKIGDEAKIRVRTEVSLMSACIIFATRQANVQRSFKEVATVTGAKMTDVGKVYTSLHRAIEAEQDRTGVKLQPIVMATATHSADTNLDRFSNLLGLDKKITKAARHIASVAVSKPGIDGRNPRSIAAGVLQLTCILFDESTSIKEIAKVARVTEATTKLLCKMIAKDLDAVIRPEWKKEHERGYETLLELGRAFSGTSKSSRSRSQSVTPAAPASPSVDPAAKPVKAAKAAKVAEKRSSAVKPTPPASSTSAPTPVPSITGVDKKKRDHQEKAALTISKVGDGLLE